jgi:hypothetical protein
VRAVTDKPIVLLDTHKFEGLAEELGMLEEQVGQLITPICRHTNQNREAGFAIDNGAFAKSGFNAKSFASLLEREKPNRDKCLFVVVPDVVGSARRTQELFDHYYPSLAGWRIALACQDGQEDLPIKWNLIDAVFIGGSDKWKTSPHSEYIIRCAKAMGKWVHVGRVNSATRWLWCCRLGVDSVDGTGLSRFTRQRNYIRDAEELTPNLYDEEVETLL